MKRNPARIVSVVTVYHSGGGANHLVIGVPDLARNIVGLTRGTRLTVSVDHLGRLVYERIQEKEPESEPAPNPVSISPPPRATGADDNE